MLSLSSSSLAELAGTADPLGLFSFEDAGLAANALAPKVRKELLKRAEQEGFSGKAGEVVSFMASDGAREHRFFLAGLGKRKSFDAETLRRASAALYHAAKKRCKTIGALAPEPVEAAAEGLLLASYAFDKYRKPDEPPQLTQARLIYARADKALADALNRAQLSAEAVCWVRDLVNEGPSEKSPETLAKLAQGLTGHGVRVEVHNKSHAQRLGMGAFLGVARGSSRDPYFLHLVYKPAGPVKKRVGLVGKGITFDSGGLSLKDPQHMETMKLDMAGAATVLGLFRVLPRLKPKAEVHGFAPLTYNMPGPDALKPGDIVKALNGKTIEILNTDAEGRLILADALAYASKQKLDVLLDLATLTGAALIALGSSVTAAMTNDKALLDRVLAASKKTSEAIWELPLVKEYKENIKSKVADLQNIGKVRGEAGTIIGGLFLQEFVDSVPWVHFDIAGTAWADKDGPYCPPGGTGAMVRTLLEYLHSI